jgi:hypothetical protein
MIIIEGILVNGILSMLLCATLIGLGRVVLCPFRKEDNNSSLASYLATSLAAGLAFYTVILHQLALREIQLKWFILSASITGLISFLYFGYKDGFALFKFKIAILCAGSALGIWAILPGLVSLFNNGVRLGMVTRGNNDIAFYAAVASEFLKTGFTNSNHVGTIDLNFAAANSHYFSPTALFTLSSGLTGLETWQTAMFVMICSFSFSWLALAGLSENIFSNGKNRKLIGYVVASITMLSGLIVYIYGNYFLAQILSLGISALILDNCYTYFVKKDHSRYQLAKTLTLTILTFYTYPHILIPFFIASVALSLGIAVLKDHSLRLQELFKFSLGLIGGVACSIPYIHFSAFFFRNMSEGATAGWPLPALNPAQITFWPQLIGWPTPKILNLLSWVIFFVLILIAASRIKVEAHLKYLVLSISFGGSGLIFTYLILKSQNFDAYTSWKLISYLFPVVAVLVLSLVGYHAKLGVMYLSILLGAFSMSPALMWSQAQWKDLSLGVSITSEMGDLSNLDQISKLKSVNIDVDPMFETMALTSIVKAKKIYPNKASYFPVGTDLDACTIVHSNSNEYEFMIKLNEDYSLASTLKGKCSARKPDLEFDRLYATNTDNHVSLSQGWSLPEPWGTWSTGEVSSFQFQAKFESNSEYLVILNTSGFVTPANPKMVVGVYFNNIFAKNLIFNPESQQREDTFNLTSMGVVLSGDETINVSFKIDNPKSPQELGLSRDPRKLGLGLISFKILKN